MRIQGIAEYLGNLSRHVEVGKAGVNEFGWSARRKFCINAVLTRTRFDCDAGLAKLTRVEI